MENIINRIKSGITSLVALLGALAILSHLTGIYEFPNPEFMDKKWEAGIGLAVCAGLWYLKDSEVTEFVRQIWNTLLNIFKKKAE